MSITQPRRPDTWDRVLPIYAACCLIAGVAIQFHHHALWFQNAASSTREATLSTKGQPHSPVTHHAGGRADRRARSSIRHQITAAAGRNPSRLAASLRATVAHRRLHCPLRIHGRRSSLQRRQLGAVADQRAGASVGVSLEARP